MGSVKLEDLSQASATIFDKIEDNDTVKIVLEVEQGLPEWRAEGAEPKRYMMNYAEETKTMIADFSELAVKELNRALLDDAYKIAGDLGAEDMYVAVSLLEPEKDRIVRNLIVYGFEPTDSTRFTSNPEVLMLHIEVNQEDDFVDLI